MDEREYAAHQLESEADARRAVARGCGIALVALTRVLDAEEVVLDRSVDPLRMVLVAFVARGRRLLRAAFRLYDAGDEAEAVPSLRILSEYNIVGRWLAEHPDRLGAWAKKDHDKRDVALRGMLGELGDSEQDRAIREIVNQQREQLAAQAEEWMVTPEELAAAGPVPNSVEQMATDVGLGFAYQLQYRLQSQYDVHATTLAVDACYERLDDGRIRLRSRPAYALSGWDQYALCAHMLRDLVQVTSDHMPGFMWTTGLTGITAALEALRESDPRKEASPVDAMLRTAADVHAAREQQAGRGTP